MMDKFHFFQEVFNYYKFNNTEVISVGIYFDHFGLHKLLPMDKIVLFMLLLSEKIQGTFSSNFQG
jgi:hypothetical protein